MVAPVVDERKHYDTVKAEFAALLGAEPGSNEGRVFEFGKVPGADGNPGVLPTIYVVVSIERVSLPTIKADRRPSRSMWRASARFVGRTVKEASWASLQVTTALDGRRLVVDGRTSTPVRFETSNSIEPDDGRQSGLSTWLYGL